MTPIINAVKCSTFERQVNETFFGPKFSRNGQLIYYFLNNQILVYDNLISQLTTLTGDLNMDYERFRSRNFYEFDAHTILITFSTRNFPCLILTLDYERNQFSSQESSLHGLDEQDRVRYKVFKSHLPDKCLVEVRTSESNYRIAKVFLVDKNGTTNMMINNWHLTYTTHIRHFNPSTKCFYTYDHLNKSTQKFELTDDQTTAPNLVPAQRFKNAKIFFTQKEDQTTFSFNKNFGYKVVLKEAMDADVPIGVARLYVYNMDNGEIRSIKTNIVVALCRNLFSCFSDNVIVLYSSSYANEGEENTTYRLNLSKPLQLSELVWYARPLDFPLDHAPFRIGR